MDRNKRTVAPNNLEGATQIKPVSVPRSGLVGVGFLPKTELQSSYDKGVLSSLSKWGNKTLDDMQNRENNESLLEGQMAHAQGKTFEEVEMSGNKWALDGYRMVAAQAAASGLMLSQEQEITTELYKKDPDEYRGIMHDRIKTLLDSAPDARSAQLITAQLSTQIPALAAAHTRKHLEWKEQENYDTLEESVDLISRDSTAEETLIGFASGEADGPTSGLSDARRQSAVASGIVRAFSNENPNAYAVLSRSGALDNMPPSLKSRIDTAKRAYDGRRRSEYNKDLLDGREEIYNNITAGADVEESLEALSTLYAEHEIQMSQADAGQIYTLTNRAQAAIADKQAKAARALADAREKEAKALAKMQIKANEEEAKANKDRVDAQVKAAAAWTKERKQAVKEEAKAREKAEKEAQKRFVTEERTVAVMIDEARERKDYDAVADLTGKYVVWAESRGNRDAKGPKITVGANAGDRAQYEWQVMPKTAKDPGFGILPAQDNSPEEYARVGKEYWRAMVKRYDGDIEAAAVAYNAGFGQADEWVKTRDYSVLADPEQTKPYAQGIAARANAEHVLSPEDRLDRAEAHLKATKERLALDVYTAIAPRLAVIDENARRRMYATPQQYFEARSEVYQEYDRARTKADIDHEINTALGIEKGLYDEAAKAQASAEEQENLLASGAEIALARADFSEVVAAYERGEVGEEQVTQAQAAFQRARSATLAKYDVPMQASEELDAIESSVALIKKAIPKRKKLMEENALIQEAVSSGTLGDLPEHLQERAAKEFESRTLKNYTDAVGSGVLEEKDANAGIQEDITTFYAQSGLMTKRMHRVLNGMLAGDLVDKDGIIKPEYLEAVQQYAKIHKVNPTTADKYIDDSNRPVIDAIMSAAGDGPLEAGISAVGVRLQNAKTFEDVDAFMRRPDVQRKIDASVSNYLNTTDIGLFQAMFWSSADLSQRNDRSADHQGRIGSPEVGTHVKSLIRNEVELMQSIRPNLQSDELVSAAAARVSRRIAVIGGDVVPLPRGKNIYEEFFGARANDMMSVDDAINGAVATWLRSEEAAALNPEVQALDMLEFMPQPGPIADLMSGLPLVGGLFESDAARTVTTREALSVANTGLRPFTAGVNPNTGQIFVSVLMTNGNYSEPIVIPARRAGDLFRERMRDRAIE